LGMKSHTTRLTDVEKGLGMTPAEEKAVAEARRFARECGLEGELWVLRGEQCGTLALGHCLDAQYAQGRPIRVVTRIAVGNDKTPPKIAIQSIDGSAALKRLGWKPIERNGKPITVTEAIQGWDAGLRDEIQEVVDDFERSNKRQAGRQSRARARRV
jgi:hypothetical protein